MMDRRELLLGMVAAPVPPTATKTVAEIVDDIWCQHGRNGLRGPIIKQTRVKIYKRNRHVEDPSRKWEYAILIPLADNKSAYGDSDVSLEDALVHCIQSLELL